MARYGLNILDPRRKKEHIQRDTAANGAAVSLKVPLSSHVTGCSSDVFILLFPGLSVPVKNFNDVPLHPLRQSCTE